MVKIVSISSKRQQIAELNDKIAKQKQAINHYIFSGGGTLLLTHLLRFLYEYFFSLTQEEKEDENYNLGTYALWTETILFGLALVILFTKATYDEKTSQNVKPFLDEKDFRAYIKNINMEEHQLDSTLEQRKETLASITRNMHLVQGFSFTVFTFATHILSNNFLNSYIHAAKTHHISINIPFSAFARIIAFLFPLPHYLLMPQQFYTINKEREDFFKQLEENRRKYANEFGKDPINEVVKLIETTYKEYNKRNPITFKDFILNLSFFGSFKALADYFTSSQNATNSNFFGTTHYIYKPLSLEDKDKKAYTALLRHVTLQQLTYLCDKFGLSFSEESALHGSGYVNYLIKFKPIKLNEETLIPAVNFSSIFHNVLLKQIPNVRIFEDIKKAEILVAFKEPYPDKIKKLEKALNDIIEPYKQQCRIRNQLNSALQKIFAELNIEKAEIDDAKWFYAGQKKENTREYFYFSLYLPPMLAQKEIYTKFNKLVQLVNEKKITTEAKLILDSISDTQSNDTDICLTLKIDASILTNLHSESLFNVSQKTPNKTLPNRTDAYAAKSANQGKIASQKPIEKPTIDINSSTATNKKPSPLPKNLISFTFPDGSVEVYDPQSKLNRIVSLGEHKYATLQDKNLTLSREQWNKAFTTLESSRRIVGAVAQQGVVRDKGFYKLKMLGTYGNDRIPCSQLVRSEENTRDLLLVFDGSDWVNHKELDLMRPQLEQHAPSSS